MADDESKDAPQGTPDEGADRPGELADPGRRNFMMGAAAVAAAAGAAGVGAYAGVKMQGTPHDEFPVPTEEDLPPFDQRNMLWTFAMSAKLNDEHPERTEKFGGFSFHDHLTKTYMKGPNSDVPGYPRWTVPSPLRAGSRTNISHPGSNSVNRIAAS